MVPLGSFSWVYNHPWLVMTSYIHSKIVGALALQEQPGSEAIGAGPVPTSPSLGALPHWVVRGSCGFLKQEPGSAPGVPRICQAAQGAQGNRPADLWLCVTTRRSNSMTCATTTLLAFESNCLTNFAPLCCVHWQSWCILSLRGDSGKHSPFV